MRRKKSDQRRRCLVNPNEAAGIKLSETKPHFEEGERLIGSGFSRARLNIKLNTREQKQHLFMAFEENCKNSLQIATSEK